MPYCFHSLAEGIIESTGMTTQARSSYLPSEILWGHRFQSLVTFKKDTGEYVVDYALFNDTVEVDTPLCSAKQLDEHRAMFNTGCGSGELVMIILKIFFVIYVHLGFRFKLALSH